MLFTWVTKDVKLKYRQNKMRSTAIYTIRSLWFSYHKGQGCKTKSIGKTKCYLLQFTQNVHYSSVITRGKLLMETPSLNLCKADQHPFINGHHLMIVCFNYKCTQNYVMSVCMSAKRVKWPLPTIIHGLCY